MFNRNIKHLFAKVDADPSQTFVQNLHKQLSLRTSKRRLAHPFRFLALTGSALLIVLSVATLWHPVDINQALAESIIKTFSFRPTGYHHLKMLVERYDPGFDVMQSYTSETWTDGTHAIMEVDQRKSGWNLNSSYYDSQEFISCSVSIYNQDSPPPACDTPQFLTEKMSNQRPEGTKALPLVGPITIEKTTDTHGDLYLTWVTDRSLLTTTITISSGPYGYEHGAWNGTYSWQNDSGQYVNRVTWFSENMLQSEFNEEPHTSFLIQIKEVSEEDLGSMNGTVAHPLAQSDVYLVDLNGMIVTPVSDEWLATSRSDFDHKLIQSTVSTKAIAREYEMSYLFVTDIGNSLDRYTLEREETVTEDGQEIEKILYNLGDNGPSIDTVTATRAEFARDADTGLIRWMKLYDATGRMIYHVKLLAFEESATAPENIFSIDAWKAHIELVK